MSMIEVLIGVMILALVLIPSMNVILSETRTVTATRDHVQAAFVAQSLLEKARAYPFDRIEADQYATDATKQQTTFEWGLKNDPKLKKIPVNHIDYEVKEVAIEPVKNKNAPNDPPTLVVVKFSIDYHGTDGRDHRLPVATALSKEE